MDPNNKSSSSNKGSIFKTCHVHIFPAGLGKKRLSLFQTHILNQGGICVSKLPVSDCNLTHIVLEDSILRNPERCAKLLRSVCMDKNMAVKVVGTQWISKCLKEQMYVDTKEFELSPVVNVTDKVSIWDNIAPNGGDDADPMKRDLEDVPSFAPPPKKLKPEVTEITLSCESQKYACSQQSSKSGEKSEYNQLVIAELQKLSDVFRNCGDQWRSYGYRKAISAIKAYGSEIKSYEEAKSIPGVGSKIAAKVSEFLTSGHLRKVDEICGNEKSQVVELFTKVWGAGPTTVQSWYLQGFRTLEDLKTKADLTKQQKIGLKHFDDIEDRIPREEVEKIGAVVEEMALAIEPRLNVELCGSYRRGKTMCGDVDVLITKPDDICGDILSRLMAQLKETGFITDDLVNMEVNRNQKKYLGLCCLPGKNQKHRRLDIFVVPQSEYATALMHYTGSALFNCSIRLLATRKGMRLSEQSLRAGVVREGKDRLNDGYIVPTPTEESIFRLLELEYRLPEERDH